MNRAVEMIALDLDDTLLKHDLTLSGRNKSVILRTAEAGIHIVLASGRNIHSMDHYVKELGLDGRGGYLICTNGAEILEIDGHRIVYEKLIHEQACRQIASFVSERGFPYQMYSEGKIWVSSKNRWTEEDTRLTGQPNILISEPDGFFKRGQLKFVIPGDPQKLDILEGEMKAIFGTRFTIFLSKPYFLEILDEGVDKGSALTELAKIIGVEREKIMAVGDAMNDFNMLRWVGIPCAPKNAIPRIKSIATYVSDFSNEEDAVADLIDRVVFRNI